jgi:LuxR family transcriptional regulator, activator of conjugal transfer of Ti plasmids
MHLVFQAFIDGLVDSVTPDDLRCVLGAASAALDLNCFAYLLLSNRQHQRPTLVSNYPLTWTDHYLRQEYQRVDPVIIQALATPEPFEWGGEFGHWAHLKAATHAPRRGGAIRHSLWVHCTHPRWARAGCRHHICCGRAASEV